MGLGLAIVRHLVELQGGTVSVDSAGENQGSTFRVHLPLASVPKPLPTSKSLAQDNADFAKALNGLRVLLVEDEPDARELIAILLQGSGATVEAVDTASTALQRLSIFIPDVLVSDIGLPRESGYDLIRQIRSMSSDINKIPAIALTAFATEKDRKMSLSAGFQAHLAKPVEPSHLLQTIKTLANGRS
jgi:CheY-like chemotaxis protein